jgi:hypothetical protein
MYLCGIRDLLKTIKQEEAAVRTEQKWILDYDDAQGKTIYKLELNRFDRDFFRREVQTITDPPPIPTLASHGLIRKAKVYLWTRITNEFDNRGNGDAALQWLFRLRNIVTDHISLIAVTSTDEDNAASVFETLNYRGIGLSTPDLLRNFLLRRAKENERDEIIDDWRAVLEIEDAKAEEFLRHFWLSREGDVKARGLYREIKSTVTQRETSSLTLATDLRREALTYENLVAGRDNDPRVKGLLADVRELGAKALYPVIMSLYNAVDNAESRYLTIRDLVTLYVRYVVVGQLEGTRLESKLYTMAKNLRGDADVVKARKQIREAAPTDGDFENSFRTVVVESQKQARYLLKEIEHFKRKTKELKVEAPDRVHLEHIYPQKPKDGEQLDKHDAWVNRLGNLTLLAKRLNEGIRNSNFVSKRPFYDESDLLVAKELGTNAAQWNGISVWDEKSITKRQDELAVIGKSVWSL